MKACESQNGVAHPASSSTCIANNSRSCLSADDSLRFGPDRRREERSALASSVCLESTMPLESYLPATTLTSQSAIFRTVMSGRTDELPWRFLCMHLFWPTATFVSLQPKVAERTLCLATHVLHITGFTQALVLHIWTIRLSIYGASLITRQMTSHYGEFLSNSDPRSIAKIHSDVSRSVDIHCSALRNRRRGALPGSPVCWQRRSIHLI